MRIVIVGLLAASTWSYAVEPGEEIELSSATVTALPCAQEALKSGKFDLLTSCPLEATEKGLVVVDVADRQLYKLSPKSIRTSDLERAFGGGAIDVTGTVTQIDKRDGIAMVNVTSLRVTPTPKPGAFKGCL